MKIVEASAWYELIANTIDNLFLYVAKRHCKSWESDTGHDFIGTPFVIKNDKTTIATKYVCKRCGKQVEVTHTNITTSGDGVGNSYSTQ